MSNGLQIIAQMFVTGNLLLIQGLGLYALTRYTKDVKSAAKTGLNTFVAMVVGGVLLWLLGGIIPSSLGLQVGFYLAIGLVAALVAPYILGQKTCDENNLFDSALVGLFLLMGRDGIAGIENLWFAVAGGLAYLATLVVLATLREDRKSVV